MYTLKITTALNAERRSAHTTWQEAVQEGARAIRILFPATEWGRLRNHLDIVGEIHGGGIRIEIFDKKMEAWH
jgi:hypothetical protein